MSQRNSAKHEQICPIIVEAVADSGEKRKEEAKQVLYITRI